MAKCLLRFVAALTLMVISALLYAAWSGAFEPVAIPVQLEVPSSSEPTDDYSLPCPSVGSFEHEQLSYWQKFKRALADYKDFHKQQLHLLTTGNHSVRTLTYHCPDSEFCGGMGDQMYTAQLELLLAMISKRVFCIHWNKASARTMKFLRPHEIDWEFFNTELGMHENITKELTAEGYREGKGNLMIDLLESSTTHITLRSEVYKPFQRGYHFLTRDPTIAARLDKLGLGGLFGEVSESELLPFLCGQLLRFLFTLSTEVITAVNGVQESLGIMNQRYVGVHIRTGFVGSNQEEFMRNRDKTKYLKDEGAWLETLNCSVQLATQYISSNASVYFATDSTTVKTLARDKFPSRIKTGDLTLQHSQLQVPAYKTTVDAFMSAWLDFLLLARSHVLVRYKSGFSTVAGQFCSIAKQYCLPKCEPSTTGSCDVFV